MTLVYHLANLILFVSCKFIFFIIVILNDKEAHPKLLIASSCLCCVAAAIFGQHLEETMLYEAQCGSQRLVPALVEKCVCFIREHGLKEEGLFRAPGQTNHVRELQGAFDRGEKLVFDR